MWPAAASFSAFLDVPRISPIPNAAADGDNLVLPYIARMLMEEDDASETAGELPCQYAGDPTALLQAQQLYAQILSDDSSAANAIIDTWPGNYSLKLASLPSYSSDDVDTLAASMLSSGAQENHTVEPGSFLPADESSCVDLVTMAFHRGKEEATRFLPKDVSWRKRLAGGDNDGDETEVDAGTSRCFKQAAAPPESESSEEAAACEMLEKMMLNGTHDGPRCLAGGDGVADEARGRGSAVGVQETPPPPLWRRRRTRHEVDLHTLLTRCAVAVAGDDRRGVAHLLRTIRGHSSPTGDGMQRLAHYFADALEARQAGTGRQLYRSLRAKGTSTAAVVKAYQLCMAVCCFVPVQILFSNATICNAVAGRKKLHVVHYGLGHGLQWPDLLRRLASRDGGPPEVRLTGIDAPLPGFHPSRLIEKTGRRLSRCARQYGVPFKFHGIAAKMETVRAEDLNIDPDEVLAVNSYFHFRTLMEESFIVERANPRDVVLDTIRKMRPTVFTHGVTNGSYCAAYFLTRFREALNNFTSMFDMMDTILPRDSEERRLVEEGFFARIAGNVIACEGSDRVERSQTYKQWDARSRRAGLRQLPLDPCIFQMIKDKVRKESHRYFMIDQDEGWLLYGWKGRVLDALSVWTSDNDV